MAGTGTTAMPPSKYCSFDEASFASRLPPYSAKALSLGETVYQPARVASSLCARPSAACTYASPRFDTSENAGDSGSAPATSSSGCQTLAPNPLLPIGIDVAGNSATEAPPNPVEALPAHSRCL